jgi:hypothetical protein
MSPERKKSAIRSAGVGMAANVRNPTSCASPELIAPAQIYALSPFRAVGSAAGLL